ncbi:MAG: hypothetical protein QM657_18405 [Lacrimispora sp.]|uniref:hypothetical protein n=1 Tax=Lacrimispora sp. TaxID=2719234 RepID=UPI0039E5B4AE
MSSGLTMLLTVSSPSIINSGRVRLDSSITLAIIVALMSLVAPIFVAVINNTSQADQRRKEHEHELKRREQDLNAEMERQKIEYDYKIQTHKYDSYYKNQTVIFEQLLNDVGDYLSDMESLSKYSVALSSIYKAQAYTDGTLSEELKYLWGEIVMTSKGESRNDRDSAHSNALSQLSEVASMINLVLKRNAKIDI